MSQPKAYALNEPQYVQISQSQIPYVHVKYLNSFLLQYCMREYVKVKLGHNHTFVLIEFLAIVIHDFHTINL